MSESKHTGQIAKAGVVAATASCLALMSIYTLTSTRMLSDFDGPVFLQALAQVVAVSAIVGLIGSAFLRLSSYPKSMVFGAILGPVLGAAWVAIYIN